MIHYVTCHVYDILMVKFSGEAPQLYVSTTHLYNDILRYVGAEKPISFEVVMKYAHWIIGETPLFLVCICYRKNWQVLG